MIVTKHPDVSKVKWSQAQKQYKCAWDLAVSNFFQGEGPSTPGLDQIKVLIALLHPANLAADRRAAS
jgi:hypothetical protein